MEGIIIFALGAGAVVVAPRNGKRGKAALGWIARQSGFLVGRVRADVAAARRSAREEFVRARDADAPPEPNVIVSTAEVTNGVEPKRS